MREALPDPVERTNLLEKLLYLESSGDRSLEEQLELLESIREKFPKDCSPEINLDLYYLYRIRYSPIHTSQQEYIFHFGETLLQLYPRKQAVFEELSSIIAGIVLPGSSRPENIPNPGATSKPAPKKLPIIRSATKSSSETPASAMDRETAASQLGALPVDSSSAPQLLVPETLAKVPSKDESIITAALDTLSSSSLPLSLSLPVESIQGEKGIDESVSPVFSRTGIRLSSSTVDPESIPYLKELRVSNMSHSLSL